MCFLSDYFDYWVWFALAFSILWGIYGYNYARKNKGDIIERLGAFLAGFIGSFAGWSCFHILTIRLQMPQLYSNMDFVDIFLIIGAFIGMTGYAFEIIKLKR